MVVFSRSRLNYIYKKLKKERKKERNLLNWSEKAEEIFYFTGFWNQETEIIIQVSTC
jgi:siroheme synthase (precorrin-2 oxidase/ferrochelatase)